MDNIISGDDFPFVAPTFEADLSVRIGPFIYYAGGGKH